MQWLMNHWGEVEPHAGKYVAVLSGTLYVGDTREEAIGKARIASGDPAADPVCLLIDDPDTVYSCCFDPTI